MAATAAPVCAFGTPAPDFTLPDTGGRVWSRDALRGSNGLVLMFICNHCPYVLAIVDKLSAEGRALQAIGFGVAAICSNDAESHPADGFDQMGAFARRHGFAFPYLHDADQSVARGCGAACTPEFFGYDAGLGLQYRGRLDDSGAVCGPARGASCSRRCASSPKPAPGRASRPSRSAARSSGRRRDPAPAASLTLRAPRCRS